MQGHRQVPLPGCWCLYREVPEPTFSTPELECRRGNSQAALLASCPWFLARRARADVGEPRSTATALVLKNPTMGRGGVPNPAPPASMIGIGISPMRMNCVEGVAGTVSVSQSGL